MYRVNGCRQDESDSSRESFSPAVDPAYAPKVETGAYSTGKMQGFGNPNFPTKASEPSKVSALASSAATK